VAFGFRFHTQKAASVSKREEKRWLVIWNSPKHSKSAHVSPRQIHAKLLRKPGQSAIFMGHFLRGTRKNDPLISHRNYDFQTRPSFKYEVWDNILERLLTERHESSCFFNMLCCRTTRKFVFFLSRSENAQIIITAQNQLLVATKILRAIPSSMIHNVFSVSLRKALLTTEVPVRGARLTKVIQVAKATTDSVTIVWNCYNKKYGSIELPHDELSILLRK